MKALLLLLLTGVMSMPSDKGPIVYDSEIPNRVSSDTIKNEKQEIISTVKGFLVWYKKHYTETHDFDILYQDNQGYYQVSISQSEQYLSYLKSSGFVSDKYIDLWTKYFKDKAAYLKENLQNEGPPEGFEYDLVLITQEPELILNGVDYLTFEVAEHNDVFAILKMGIEQTYDVEVVKENGKWLIEYIATSNYD